MIRRSLVLLVAVGLLAGAGCGDDEPDVTASSTPRSGASTSDLDGRTFVSSAVTGHDLVAGSTVSLSFDAGRLTARAGCNTMSGSYTVEGGVLRLSEQMASTAMGCEPDLMAQDDWLGAFLASSPGMAVDADTLTLTSGDVTVTLVDEAVASPALPLAGTEWILETIVDGETASSVPAGVDTPTFQIGEDGFAVVFTGCNRGRAAAGVDGTGTVLSLGPLALTEMACPGDAQGVELAVVAVLDGDVAFVIDGDRLTLTQGSQGLGYRAG